MRNNETGEFELVVGNRQLLSGFFIVVLLFAVAFAMGRIPPRSPRAIPTPHRLQRRVRRRPLRWCRRPICPRARSGS
jgi:hypothetical protein